MHKNEHNSSVGSGVGGLVVGLLAGVGLGFLFAPKSGKQTRAQIKHSVQDAGDQVKDRVERFADEEVKPRVEELKDKAGSAVNRGQAGKK